eukprot:3190433-Amphidinium_carterae.1
MYQKFSSPDRSHLMISTFAMHIGLDANCQKERVICQSITCSAKHPSKAHSFCKKCSTSGRQQR